MASITPYHNTSQFAFNAVPDPLPLVENQPHEATHSTLEATPSDRQKRYKELSDQIKNTERALGGLQLGLAVIQKMLSMQQVICQQDVDDLASMEEEISKMSRELLDCEGKLSEAERQIEILIEIRKNRSQLSDLEQISGENSKIGDAKKQKEGEESSQREAEALRQQIKSSAEHLKAEGVVLQDEDLFTCDIIPLFRRVNEKKAPLSRLKLSRELLHGHLVSRKARLEMAIRLNGSSLKSFEEGVKSGEKQIVQLQQELEKNLKEKEALAISLAVDQDAVLEGSFVFVSESLSVVDKEDLGWVEVNASSDLETEKTGS